MERNMTVGIVALVALLILVGLSAYTVRETERAILFRLGEIVSTESTPGLHFKVPLITTVRKFDARILTLDVGAERYLTGEKKNLIVDAYVKWRIEDVSRFYTAMRGDETQAAQRLTQVVKDSLRSEFGKRTIQDVVSGDRGKVMDIVTVNANQQAQAFGMRVIDTRLKRIDLPEDVSDSVYRRMEAERARVARELRSQGAEEAERIRADADRQRTEILAAAYRDAERARGEGDARASEIYGQAYGKNAEFASFYRSLSAYRNSFKDRSDVLVIDPQSDFFKYFKSPQGGR